MDLRNVTYTPPPDFSGTGVFTYTLNDGSCTAGGQVVVLVGEETAGGGRVTILPLKGPPPAHRLGFDGIPGHFYVFRIPGDTFGPWLDLAPSLRADARGLVTYIHGNPPQVGFYRVRSESSDPSK